MSSQGWDLNACELGPPGTRPERELREPGYLLHSRKPAIYCPLRRALSCRVARVIYKLLYLAQLADDAYYRAHGASLENFDILENEILVFSHWAHDTIPVTCYSHNDRGHHIPLQSAISSGCMSIEMTIFPAGNELLVGPNPEMLSRAMNLRDLYIDPLLRTIKDFNKKLENIPSEALPQNAKLSGVFPNDPTRSLVLLMDFNADPERIWSHLIPQIEPLREAGFLTHFNGSNVVQGPITIVATGNIPFHRILEGSIFRDVFFDAPLLKLLPPFEQKSPNIPTTTPKPATMHLPTSVQQ
ncbi:hypothetical protein N7494_003318 [Penicillium frequentans]|uniref:Uncharacterized protein n=1 Tax=Penicillium frequentans TaxID=3151616 RepID=A0AAD6CYD8_9EURO|nr:hypothetical protein N7494_003318 [Penicillium glabrum]